MMVQSGIYAIIATSGCVYVGSTINFKTRWRAHRGLLRRGIHKNPHLQAAYDKYGLDAFALVICEYIEDKEQLHIREQHWLDYHRMWTEVFNWGPVARHPRLGTHSSEETKRKLSEAWKTRPPCSDETRAKISAALKGYKRKPFSEEHRRKLSEAGKNRAPMSDETRAKISTAHKGRKRTDESRRKQSEAQKGRPLSEEHRAKLSAAQKKRFESPEARRKLSEAHKGIYPSEETKRKMSESQKARAPATEEACRKISEAKNKPYPAFVNRDTGEVIPAGVGLKAMCKDRGLGQGHMGQVVHGQQPHHKGWVLQSEHFQLWLL